MTETTNKFFKWVDDKIGPDRKKHGELCHEDRQMLMECVLESDCFKKREDFIYCMREGIDKECKALRYNFFRCRRSTLFWEKSLRDDPR